MDASKLLENLEEMFPQCSEQLGTTTIHIRIKDKIIESCIITTNYYRNISKRVDWSQQYIFTHQEI